MLYLSESLASQTVEVKKFPPSKHIILSLSKQRPDSSRLNLWCAVGLSVTRNIIASDNNKYNN